MGGFGSRLSYRTSKEFLIYKYGRKCWICGITEWTGQPVPLVFDHIDGNSDNQTFENCRLVCGNCDMLLPTYKSKNKAVGRRAKMRTQKNQKNSPNSA